MHKDARALIKACQECQVHKPVPRNPQEKLNPITSPWLFYKWGIDIAGPFPKGPGKIWSFGEIISDNGKQFRDNPFKDWCEKLCIQQHFASVKHPQTNGLGKKDEIEFGEQRLSSQRDWNATFRYLQEVELGLRRNGLGVRRNKINLELLEEKREQAAIREAKSKRQMEKYYNAKVRNTSFKPGDLVYRNNEASHAEDTGKLGPKWKGPYEGDRQNST
ncbi:reverse transcriptase domain-containing protein [Tanacetum coccineum]|uniref:Reverse transcriptase domain-containing protein n=1 Tax=Tanacetum coccineum TaxID=301880 RepID=A0ABQ5DN86_9ASTR